MSTTTSHLSRWIPFSKSTVRDRAASARPLMESLEPRLLLSGSVAIETYMQVEPGPLVGEMVSIDPPGSDILQAFVGDTIIWTYEVTNTGDEPLSVITVIDDNGTSGDDTDDFMPTPIMAGDYNVGDTNVNGTLDVVDDVTERWLYTARSLVFDEGPYENVASVTASFEEVVSGGEDAGFTQYALLANGEVTIADSFTVTGGILGSNYAAVAALSIEASMGVRGAGTFVTGFSSTIGSAESDSIVFNGGTMIYMGTTVNGDIRIGENSSVYGMGANVLGDIYVGDGAWVDLSYPDFPEERVFSGDNQPFTPLDLPTPLPFIEPTPVDNRFISDGGTLRLGSGTHYFDSLTIGEAFGAIPGEGATLELMLTDEPISIIVDGNMSLGDDVTMVFLDENEEIIDDPAADQVYFQIGNLTARANAELYGTVYSPSGNFYFGSGLQMTGALYGGGFMTFGDNSVITYEELDFEALGIDVGGGGGTETFEVDASYSAQYEGVLPPIDISSLSQKAEALLVQYTGNASVRIVASDKADIDNPKARIYFDGEVTPGETFAIDALMAGKSKLKGETYITIFALDGEIIGTVQIHTALDEPTVLGDEFGQIRLVGFIGDEGARAGIVPVEMLTGLSGFVFEDFNGDGLVDQDEYAITGATVTLTRFDYKGDEISSLSVTTDSDGAYYFDALRPGNYTITEDQPVGYNDGADTVGTAGGLLGSDAISEIVLGAYVEGVNYNFAEHNAGTPGLEVAPAQTATIGFWAGKNGKKLIESLNGDKYSTALGDWLATEFSDMYGDLLGKTNQDVAKYYGKLFKASKKRGRHGGGDQIDLRDLNAQVMATALAVYVTDSRNFAGGAATEYGFIISDGGVGAATFNVGDSGAAFGVDNGTVMTIWEILQATNDQAFEGSLYYDMDIMLSELADKVYTMINELGGID